MGFVTKTLLAFLVLVHGNALAGSATDEQTLVMNSCAKGRPTCPIRATESTRSPSEFVLRKGNQRIKVVRFKTWRDVYRLNVEEWKAFRLDEVFAPTAYRDCTNDMHCDITPGSLTPHFVNAAVSFTRAEDTLFVHSIEIWTSLDTN